MNISDVMNKEVKTVRGEQSVRDKAAGAAGQCVNGVVCSSPEGGG